MPLSTLENEPNPSGFCQCGCGQHTTIAKRTDASVPTVKGKPTRYLRGHHNRRGPDFIVDENGCWLWQQYTTPEGYGIGRFGDKREIAHRGMYEQMVGDIPEGLHLDHLCGVRACVNPAHLEPVTPRENSKRGRATKLTDGEVRAIRTSDEIAVRLAERFGVQPKYITMIRSGRARADVDRKPCPHCDGSGWTVGSDAA